MNDGYEKKIFRGKKGDLICSHQNGIHRGQPQQEGYQRIVLVIRLFNLKY